MMVIISFQNLSYISQTLYIIILNLNQFENAELPHLLESCTTIVFKSNEIPHCIITINEILPSDGVFNTLFKMFKPISKL